MAAVPRPITRGELIYRGIPLKQGWVDPQGIVSPAAFLPNKGDRTTGISVSRALPGETPQQTAQRVGAGGTSGNDYGVVAMPAASLLDAEIPVVPDEVEGDTSHAQIQGWTYDRRDTDAVRRGAEKAASAVTAVYNGPYPGQRLKPLR